MSQRLNRLPGPSKRGDVQNPGARLYVPGSIAKHVPDGAQFECELTVDGILFRLVNLDLGGVELPAWANRQNGDGS